MLRVFQDDIQKEDGFIATIELVPGRESMGRSVDTVIGIASDAFADGRISAVSITDNPGGNPSLSPDVLGYDIFRLGLDVIVHFTCRDMNRVGMESRALQLARMGMKNILALNGDYSGQGFGGQGAPVFDLDSVNLQALLGMLSERIQASGDPDGFFAGCAVSPFKQTEGECFAQYAKLCRKIASGARFIITQLGYDAAKFRELIEVINRQQIRIPVLGSVYVLTPKTARIMNSGKIPGAVVSDRLCRQVLREWRDPGQGRKAAIERSARLAAVLKGLGYRGVHIGGIHNSFQTAAAILDRLEQIQDHWRDFLGDFDDPMDNGFYLFSGTTATDDPTSLFEGVRPGASPAERLKFQFFDTLHALFFNAEAAAAPLYRKVGAMLDQRKTGRLLAAFLEDPVKKILLGCLHCGDCGIQHLAYQCPESGCPKHIRNGACGGSRDGRCEVRQEQDCVWYRAYNRLAACGRVRELAGGCIPPRKWEINGTSSWLNFHLGRDHQGPSAAVTRFCRTDACGPAGKI